MAFWKWIGKHQHDVTRRLKVDNDKSLILTIVNVGYGSPEESQRELNVAIVGHCFGNSPELRCIERPVRNVNLWSIRNIEELRSELQFPLAFRIERDIFKYRNVEVGERRTCPDVATCIPERKSIRYPKSGSVNPMLYR